jgi:O-antigen/teichoic acid export membrane protein
MGFIQKDALRTMLISYLGLILGYVNKGLLFLVFLSTEQIGLVNLIVAVGLLFAQFSNLGSIYAIWRFFPFFRNKEKNNYGFLTMMLIIVGVGILLCTAATFLFQDKIAEYYSEKSKEFVHYYYWIIPVGIANVLFLIFENYLRSMYNNILSVFVYEFLFRLLITILLVLFAFNYIDFEFFLIAHSLVYFVPTLVLAIYLIRINELRFKLSEIQIPKRFKKIIWNFSLFSYFNSLGTLLVTTLDAMMIASMIGLEATGVYTTVIYLSSALQIPYKSLLRVSSPLIPMYWKERNYDEMNQLYTKVSSISLIIALTI